MATRIESEAADVKEEASVWPEAPERHAIDARTESDRPIDDPLPEHAPVIDEPGREVPVVDPNQRDVPRPVREPPTEPDGQREGQGAYRSDRDLRLDRGHRPSAARGAPDSCYQRPSRSFS
jgi:hypothetical protein